MNIVMITIMIRLISLIFILLTLYWFYMLESISSTKLRHNITEAPFGIPGAITEHENNFRVKPIIESNIFSVII